MQENKPMQHGQMQVELQTARQKVVLYDTAAAPLPLMGPGHHHDFMVQHDIKELGMHTLICSAVYTAADGERRYFPENFKFSSANPLMVKTKVICIDLHCNYCLVKHDDTNSKHVLAKAFVYAPPCDSASRKCCIPAAHSTNRP